MIEKFYEIFYENFHSLNEIRLHFGKSRFRSIVVYSIARPHSRPQRSMPLVNV